MRAKLSQLVLIFFACPLSIMAQGAGQLGLSLLHIGEYSGSAKFEALLPSAADPVVYDIELQSASPADSLAPCSYSIAWAAESPSGTLSGFSAYFDGHHYRFRNSKLQEYHLSENETAFFPAGPGSQAQGVQSRVQFADLLPQFLGAKIVEIASDSSYIYTYYPDKLIGGKRRIVVEGVKMSRGYETQRFTYVFDKESLLPVQIEQINSPGSISEQLVTVTYGPASQEPVTLTEEGLMESWPDAFERFRQSTFRVENLVGEALPAFSCPVAGSADRYTHHVGEPLDAPTIIAALDPAVGTNAETVQALRRAVGQLPVRAEICWAFKTNKEDEATAAIGTIDPDERALLSANGLMRDAGITLFPTIIICSPDGKVAEVICGYNNAIEEIVIQKMALM